ncbi:tumor necrosis factor receptor superfamily member 6B [Pseudonaja textilis]|uniref:tumor necrosis factor receptor superfamily member 6B n=1 Tax=Pseudonaja textilis TaxID=8673 RepID=UPI000EA84555|nr:tumor necrosis factor receptor superfamily member 6B [Pseudonaja textilis]
MQNLCQWVILSVLLWSPLTHASPPTFEWKDPNTHEKLLCEKCPPGKSMAKPCTRDAGTLCKPCANEHYTQYWNYVDRCLYCNVRCNILEVEVGSCNGTHNRVCECKPGYHAESLFCIKHSKCPAGSGVVEPGIGDCHEAALDFVAFQLKSPRKLQRLYRKLTQTPPGTQKKKPIEELQVDFHSYLLQLKNLHGKERAWDMVQVVLVKMKLEHILKNVQRSFSVGL